MMDKKKPLIPKLLLSYWLLSHSVFWVVYALLFFFASKLYLEKDILADIYKFIFNKEASFNQCFIGNDSNEKITILNYAFYSILIIISLNYLCFAINAYLRKKDKYIIDNNSFYLHNKLIFIINSFIHLINVFLITASFVSAFSVILTLSSITLNTWRQSRKHKNLEVEKNFFWKKQYIHKLFFYSAIVIFFTSFVISSFREFHENAKNASPGSISEFYHYLINAFEPIKTVLNKVLDANYSSLHWLIFILFFKNVISERREEFDNFWAAVKEAEKKTNNFKCYYYFQKIQANANDRSINLSSYGYLTNSPKFLIGYFLKNCSDDLKISEFIQQNKRVIEYIDFIQKEVKEIIKRNFFNYCLFERFDSWDDCLKNKERIEKAFSSI